MTERPGSSGARHGATPNAAGSAGWLGVGPPVVHDRRRRVGPPFAGSIGAHAAAVAVAMFALQAPHQPAHQAGTRLDAPIVFLQARGEGGGGGGNPAPTPPRSRPIEIPRPTVDAIPLAPPVEPVRLDRPIDVPHLTAPIYTPDASRLLSSGASRISLAPVGGRGKGTGLRDGDGPGLEKGRGPGFGDGAHGPGSGATDPVVVYREPLRYTTAAVQAKIQGAVTLEAVILPDGTVGDVRIKQSLDPTHGLDQEAIRSAKLWRFKPGSLNGVPVAVIVTLVLDFRLH